MSYYGITDQQLSEEEEAVIRLLDYCGGSLSQVKAIEQAIAFIRKQSALIAELRSKG